MLKTYNSTRIACYIGYFVQAITINLSPVLFIIYQNELGISYSLLSIIVAINFITQIITDVGCVKYVEKYGQRKCAVFAHVFAFIGLLLLGVLPKVTPYPYIGLLIGTIITAIGSGMIEVLISPIVSNLPSDNDTGDMSLLHSFYCWGQVTVVLVTTLLLAVKVSWWVLPILWSIIPFVNIFTFIKVPIVEQNEKSHKISFKSLLSSKTYLVFLLLMLCAGAGELAMGQWASLFIEKSLNISKALGDIMGPCMFAVFMGIGRVVFGINGNKIDIFKALMIGSIGCFLSYIIGALSNAPLLSLFACALCGLSVSVMWPGVLSACADVFKSGATAMFALLALFGDMGCSLGPALTGFLSDFAEKSGLIQMESLRFGLLCAAIFPLVMFIVIWSFNKKQRKSF